MKKFCYIMLVIILVFIIGMNILSATDNSMLGMKIFRVGSGSMEPYLKVNSIIIVKEFDDYNIDDVITYYEDGDYITHRIVRMEEGDYITKGDANNTEDLPITKDMIVGKMIHKFESFDFIGYLLLKPVSWIFIFVIGLLIVYLIPDKGKKKEQTN